MTSGTWAIVTPAFTTYVQGELILAWHPNADGELVPYAVFGGHRFELEPGSSIRPAEPIGRPAE